MFNAKHIAGSVVVHLSSHDISAHNRKNFAVQFLCFNIPHLGIGHQFLTYNQWFPDILFYRIFASLITKYAFGCIISRSAGNCTSAGTSRWDALRFGCFSLYAIRRFFFQCEATTASSVVVDLRNVSLCGLFCQLKNRAVLANSGCPDQCVPGLNRLRGNKLSIVVSAMDDTVY